jgi:hypothetical protein
MAKNTQEVVVFIILLAIAVPIGAWLHDAPLSRDMAIRCIGRERNTRKNTY